MPLTFGSEFTLFLHTDDRLTYTQIEAAAIAAGLDDVSITRSPSGSGYDLQLSIHDDNGSLQAAETLSALSDVVEQLDTDAEPEPTPEP